MISAPQQWALSPNLYSCHLIFLFPSLCMSVAAPLEQRGNIYIQSTPPSACASYTESLSRGDEPSVSIHSSGFIRIFIYFIWFFKNFTTRGVLTTRGGGIILTFGDPFLRGWLRTVMAGLPLHARVASHWLVGQLMPNMLPKQTLGRAAVIRVWPFHKGIIYWSLLSSPVAACCRRPPLSLILHHQLLTCLNISCHSEKPTVHWTQQTLTWVVNAPRG